MSDKVPKKEMRNSELLQVINDLWREGRSLKRELIKQTYLIAKAKGELS